MKIICVGRNYADHAKELNNEVPKAPVIFMKPKTAILLPGKQLYYPEFTDDLQYEAEMVVRITKNGKFIQEKFANKYYGDVTIGIDFTARDVQREQQQKGLPWEIAKAFDGSAAVGSFSKITPETDVSNIAFQLKKNGETVQDGHSRNMIFSVDKIIAYVSQYFTLNIGDMIFTGTPAGVGPVNAGDTLEAYMQGYKVLEVEVR
ncbi:MAG: fumarylacetoacetate hydrolase [Flavipsychrobacter sp.]|jgi:2-keto-4-pentenoate hydratase/2-oxohepta-3-ene-1,7-dioic acid hydratase in catechol pathway|nr:fumarylacetoacetate hydrolase [Flavipsychrobacter sp.]